MRKTLIRIGFPLIYFFLGILLVYLGWPPRILFTWETVSEVDTAGFVIYRSQSPDGPFSRITETPVPATGDPLVGASYQYEDRGLLWGARYYYQLEEIERGGNDTRFPEVAQGRAGAGWGWALVAAGTLAALGGAIGWYIGLPTKQPSPDGQVECGDEEDGLVV